MLASELITWCNSIYQPDETSTFKITDARWLLFFNQALTELKPYIYLPVTATADIVSGTTEYATPSDFNYMIRLYKKSGSDYIELNKIDIYQDLNTYDYYIYNDTINLDTQSSDLTEGLKLYYCKTHSALETTTTIELKDPYILGYFALARVESSDRQSNEYSLYYNEYLQRRNDLISFQIDEIPSVMKEGW